MKLEDIVVMIKDYSDTINDVFPNKDYITIDELVRKVEDLYCEVDSLKEKIRDSETVYEPDPYDEWKDRQLEEEARELF